MKLCIPLWALEGPAPWHAADNAVVVVQAHAELEASTAQLKQDLTAAQAQNVKLQQDATASTASTDTQAKQQQVTTRANKLATLICTMQYWQA